VLADVFRQIRDGFISTWKGKMAKKKSSDMEFLKNNWLAILSIIIALTGGVPGLITIYRNFIKDRPILTYTLVNIITGSELNKLTNEERTMIFLVGTLSNAGNGLLTPGYFGLKGTINKKKLRLVKEIIRNDMYFDSESMNISLRNPAENDLQRFNSAISKGTPVAGNLLFLTSDITLDELTRNLNELELVLICVDIFGKAHKCPISLKPEAKIDRTYPKHNLLIKSKPDPMQTRPR
jgi:hypothetical protein